MENKSTVPIGIFPEGTSTNGRVLINFKKGAFYSLTPVKPFLLLNDQGGRSIPLAAGGMKMLINLMLTICYLSVKMEFVELPVFAPTDYLYEHFKHLGKDKPSIYANAMRCVMSEITGFPIIESNFEDKLAYMSAIKGKVIKNT